jgi:uncharacterized protein (DUF1800 family)
MFLTSSFFGVRSRVAGAASVLLGGVLAVASCSAPAAPGVPTTSRHDMLFLNRVTYGVNQSTAREFAKVGRSRYLDEQLHYDGDSALPAAVRERIAALEISRLTPSELISERRQGEQAIRKAPDPDTRAMLQKSLNERGNELALQATERRILRALYSRNQIQELLTWFWFNHFTVFQYKGYINLLLADYEEQAIRPHVLGKFRDLVLATLTHPAMLVYLDNAQNAAGAINENYARELMELHTLGVDGGYTQADVQALARILTGVGTDFSGNGCANGVRALPDGETRVGAQLFCFMPKRHDESEKTFLGQDFPAGGGAEEVVRAVDLLVRSPSTAKLISRELAVYFLSDDPPAEVVDEMAQTFQRTDGDIAQTLRALFHSAAFRGGRYFGGKYKDPVQYVLSSVRLLYEDQPIQDPRPIANWINRLGEPFYAHLTPDGYGTREKDWASADQMAKRVEIARGVFWSAGPFYVDEQTARTLESTDKQHLQDLRKQAREDHPVDSFGIYDFMRPMLSEQTLNILRKSLSLDEWNALLLSSPEFMYR